jgi:hypothetical protein
MKWRVGTDIFVPWYRFRTMSNYTEATEAVHKSGRSSGHLESPSHGKVPKWLEDMTE